MFLQRYPLQLQSGMRTLMRPRLLHMCNPLTFPSVYKGRLGKWGSQPGCGKEDQFQHITLIRSSKFWNNTGHHIINHNTARTDNARIFLPSYIKARRDGTGGRCSSSAGNANTGKMHSPTPHIHIHTHCMCVHMYHQSFTGRKEIAHGLIRLFFLNYAVRCFFFHSHVSCLKYLWGRKKRREKFLYMFSS